MRFEPFELHHMIGATTHPKQKRYQILLESETLATIGANWSALAEDGLVCVGGLVPVDGVVGAWVLFTDRVTPGRFVAIYRELARRLTELLDQGEAVLVHIDPDYPAAARLADRLGFRTDGVDHFSDGRRMTRMVADVRIS